MFFAGRDATKVGGYEGIALGNHPKGMFFLPYQAPFIPVVLLILLCYDFIYFICIFFLGSNVVR